MVGKFSGASGYAGGWWRAGQAIVSCSLEVMTLPVNGTFLDFLET
jgi:hypothetical protein